MATLSGCKLTGSTFRAVRPRRDHGGRGRLVVRHPARRGPARAVAGRAAAWPRPTCRWPTCAAPTCPAPTCATPGCATRSCAARTSRGADCTAATSPRCPGRASGSTSARRCCSARSLGRAGRGVTRRQARAGPDRPERVAAARCRPPAARRRRAAKLPGLAVVLRDDQRPVLLRDHQPAADRLGREAPVAERADRQPARAQHPRDLGEHLDGPDEVVDRHAVDDRVERAVGVRQHGVGVEVLDHAVVGHRVGGELDLVEAEDRQVPRRGAEVADPAAHQVEDVAGQAELVVQRADRGDRAVVDVGEQPRLRRRSGDRGPRRRGRRSPRARWVRSCH